MLTLLKFKADWCGPCRAMTPVVEQLDREDDRLIVQEVDIDSNPQLRVDYGIRSIPAFVLIRDQREVGRMVGSYTLSELKQFVKDAGAS